MEDTFTFNTFFLMVKKWNPFNIWSR